MVLDVKAMLFGYFFGNKKELFSRHSKCQKHSTNFISKSKVLPQNVQKSWPNRHAVKQSKL